MNAASAGCCLRRFASPMRSRCFPFDGVDFTRLNARSASVLDENSPCANWASRSNTLVVLRCQRTGAKDLNLAPWEPWEACGSTGERRIDATDLRRRFSEANGTCSRNSRRCINRARRRQDILPVPLVRNSARNTRQISISDIRPDSESPEIAVTNLRFYCIETGRRAATTKMVAAAMVTDGTRRRNSGS